jgi:hypothetical protein
MTRTGHVARLCAELSLDAVAAGAVVAGPTVTCPPGLTATRGYDLPGFVESRFSPLVHEAVHLCLGEPAGELIDGWQTSTGMVLVGTFGDAVTADVASRHLLAGLVHNPLLFYQSVPTSVFGVLTREYGITGEISCLSVDHDDYRPVLTVADLMLRYGDMRQVVVVGVELAATPRTTVAYKSASAPSLSPPRHDVAAAVLLRRAIEPATSGAAAVPADRDEVGRSDSDHGSIRELIRLCVDVAAATPHSFPHPSEGTEK